MLKDITSADALLIKSSFASLGVDYQKDVYKSLNQRCRAILLEALKTQDFDSRDVNAYGYTDDKAVKVYKDLTSILSYIELAREIEKSESENPSGPKQAEDCTRSALFVRMAKGVMNRLGRKGTSDLKKALEELNSPNHKKYSYSEIMANREQKILEYREKLKNPDLDKKEAESISNRIDILTTNLKQMKELNFLADGDKPVRAEEIIDQGGPSEVVRTEEVIDLGGPSGVVRAEDSEGEELAQIARFQENEDEFDLDGLDQSYDSSEDELMIKQAEASIKVQEALEDYTASVIQDLNDALQETRSQFLANFIAYSERELQEYKEKFVGLNSLLNNTEALKFADDEKIGAAMKRRNSYSHMIMILAANIEQMKRGIFPEEIHSDLNQALQQTAKEFFSQRIEEIKEPLSKMQKREFDPEVEIQMNFLSKLLVQLEAQKAKCQ